MNVFAKRLAIAALSAPLILTQNPAGFAFANEPSAPPPDTTVTTEIVAPQETLTDAEKAEMLYRSAVGFTLTNHVAVPSLTYSEGAQVVIQGMLLKVASENHRDQSNGGSFDPDFVTLDENDKVQSVRFDNYRLDVPSVPDNASAEMAVSLITSLAGELSVITGKPPMVFTEASNRMISAAIEQDLSIKEGTGMALQSMVERALEIIRPGNINYRDGGQIANVAFPSIFISVPESFPLRSANLHTMFIMEHAKVLSRLTGSSMMALAETGANAFLHRLDPHTQLMTLDRTQSFNEQTRGSFIGIGVNIERNGELGGIRIIAPVAGSPSERAGILAGDVVTHVSADGTPEGLEPVNDLSSASRLMRGERGTSALLGIRRGGQQLQISVERAEIIQPSVISSLMDNAPNVGHIIFKSFNDQTMPGLEQAITDLQRQAQDRGTPLEGLALDFRGNPGGLLNQALNVCDAFLDQGLILTVGRTADDAQADRYYAQAGQLFTGPIAVMTDAGSASASEIVAGCIKDHDRGELVGSRTFGKGSVGTVARAWHWAPTEISSEVGSLVWTSALFFGPSGLSNHGYGIPPTIEVHFGDDRDNVVANARHEGDLPHALTPPSSREHEQPEQIWSLRAEFSGTLSPAEVSQIPQPYVVTMRPSAPEAAGDRLVDATLAATVEHLRTLIGEAKGQSHDGISRVFNVAPGPGAPAPAPSIDPDGLDLSDTTPRPVPAPGFPQPLPAPS